MGACVKFSGTDQIADILKDQEVCVGDRLRILRKRAGHHVGVDVAETAVVDLKRLHAGRVRNSLRIQG